MACLTLFVYVSSYRCVFNIHFIIFRYTKLALTLFFCVMFSSWRFVPAGSAGVDRDAVLSTAILSRLSSYAKSAWDANGRPVAAMTTLGTISSSATKLAEVVPVTHALCVLLHLNCLLRRTHAPHVATMIATAQQKGAADQAAVWLTLLKVATSLLEKSCFVYDWVQMRMMELSYVESILTWLVDPLLTSHLTGDAYHKGVWDAYMALALAVLTCPELDPSTAPYAKRVAYQLAYYGEPDLRSSTVANLDRVWLPLGDRRGDFARRLILVCLELTQSQGLPLLRQRATQWYFDLLLLEFHGNPGVGRLQFLTIDAIDTLSARLATAAAAALAAGNTTFKPDTVINRYVAVFNVFVFRFMVSSQICLLPVSLFVFKE